MPYKWDARFKSRYYCNVIKEKFIGENERKKLYPIPNLT